MVCLMDTKAEWGGKRKEREMGEGEKTRDKGAWKRVIGENGKEQGDLIFLTNMAFGNFIGGKMVFIITILSLPKEMKKPIKSLHGPHI